MHIYWEKQYKRELTPAQDIIAHSRYYFIIAIALAAPASCFSRLSAAADKLNVDLFIYHRFNYKKWKVLIGVCAGMRHATPSSGTVIHITWHWRPLLSHTLLSGCMCECTGPCTIYSLPLSTIRWNMILDWSAYFSKPSCVYFWKANAFKVNPYYVVL